MRALKVDLRAAVDGQVEHAGGGAHAQVADLQFAVRAAQPDPQRKVEAPKIVARGRERVGEELVVGVAQVGEVALSGQAVLRAELLTADVVMAETGINAEVAKESPGGPPTPPVEPTKAEAKVAEVSTGGPPMERDRQGLRQLVANILL